MKLRVLDETANMIVRVINKETGKSKSFGIRAEDINEEEMSTKLKNFLVLQET